MRLLKLANEMGNGSAIPAGKAIKPGGRDPRLPAMANALTAGGYLEPQKAPPQTYTAAMVAAVKRLQPDFGFKPDGIIGPDGGRRR